MKAQAVVVMLEEGLPFRAVLLTARLALSISRPEPACAGVAYRLCLFVSSGPVIGASYCATYGTAQRALYGRHQGPSEVAHGGLSEFSYIRSRHSLTEARELRR